METLRIKCPSCGVVLEVRNSKNENVKRITCPNCKKQLAVTFGAVPDSHPEVPIGSLYEYQTRHQLHEGLNTMPHVASGLTELRVVRLAAGDWKYILRALTNERKVLVNGQSMLKDDEVVLLRGDEIEVDGMSFSFNKPSSKPVRPVRKTKNKSFLVALALGLVAISLAWYYIVYSPNREMAKQSDSIVAVHDTVQPILSSRQSSDVKSSKIGVSVKSAKPEAESVDEDISSQNTVLISNYSLETLAAKGDFKAQYEIGMRWVISNDCSEVVKGVRYLETAARSGHTDAQYALGIVYHKGSPSCGINRNEALSLRYMEMAARGGNQKAKKFLDSNKDE